MNHELKLQYDRRQYKLMAVQLRQFEEGKMDLASLIGGLNALLSLLEAADPLWMDDFRGEWGTLEVVHAIALDRKEQGVAPDYETTINDPSNRVLINEAVHKMWALLEEIGGERGTGALIG